MRIDKLNGARDRKRAMLLDDSLTGRPSNGQVRVLLCSIPKSGTYLVSEILANLGIPRTGFHISRDEYSDYRPGTRDEHRAHPEKFRVVDGFANALAKVPAASHAVSHLSPDADVQAAINSLNYNVLFVFRDLRDCAISYMRFLADTGRDNSAASQWIQATDPRERFVRFLQTYDWFFKNAAPICDWLTVPTALPVKFEALVGDLGTERQISTVAAICERLEIDTTQVDPKEVVTRSLSSNTLTKSEGRTERDVYWSSAADARFAELGGLALNRLLGYSD